MSPQQPELCQLNPTRAERQPGAQVVTSPAADLEVVFQQVERAKQEWEATADALPELICLVDSQGSVLRANRTIETWEIGDVRAIQGFSLHTLLHPGCLGLYCPLDRYLRQTLGAAPGAQATPYEAYDSFLHRHLQVRVQSVAPRCQTGPVMAVIVIEDITDRRRNEDALQRSLTRLAVLNEIQSSMLTARTPEEIAEAALVRLRALIPFRQARLTLPATSGRGFVMLTADANGSTHLRPGQVYTDAEFQPADQYLWRQAWCINDLQLVDRPAQLAQQLLAEGQRSMLTVPLLTEGQALGLLALSSERAAAFNANHLDVAREVGDLLAIVVRQAQLYHQLELSHRQLRHALQVKSDLIANVSHELRTPLGVIYGYTVLLDDGGLGEVTAEQTQALRVMLKHEERLRFMVERLVDLRAIDTQHLHRQPLNLADWLNLVVQPWHSQAQVTGHLLQVEIDLPAPSPDLYVDGELLKQVVDNLLDNAFKFSPPSTAVRITAKIDREMVLIAVQDFGIGLSADHLARVFEQFYQVDGSATRRYGGMGIGLALCREIVGAHGGRIWAESAGPGQGSTFWCALPRLAGGGGDYR